MAADSLPCLKGSKAQPYSARGSQGGRGMGVAEERCILASFLQGLKPGSQCWPVSCTGPQGECKHLMVLRSLLKLCLCTK